MADISQVQDVDIEFENQEFPDFTGQLFWIKPFDFDQDGDLDIFAAAGSFPPDPEVAFQDIVFENVNGDYQVFSKLTATVHPAEAIFEDFNGDGRIDLFLGTSGYDDGLPAPGEPNRLYLQTDAGFEDASNRLPDVMDFTHGVASGDIDSDGDLDIWVGNTGGPERPYLLINDGEANFTLSQERLPENWVTISPDFINFNSAKFEDVDGDGSLDLIGGLNRPSESGLGSQIVLNPGSGDFSNGDVVHLPDHAVIGEDFLVTGSAVHDFDADGLKDILFVGQRKDFTGQAFQYLSNKGNGNFVDETEERLGSFAFSESGSRAEFIGLRDVNNDGTMDFVPLGLTHRQTTPNEIVVGLNNGNGEFDPLVRTDFAMDQDAWMLGSLLHKQDGKRFIDGFGFGQTDPYRDFFVNRTTFDLDTPSATGDLVTGGPGVDMLDPGDGPDVVWADDGADRVNGGRGSDKLMGGGGADVLSGDQGADRLYGNAGDDQLSGGPGTDVVVGNGGADRLFGDAGNDTIEGFDGNDVLNGGAGDDQLWGHEGRDEFIAGSGSDRIHGGVGTDTVVFSVDRARAAVDGDAAVQTVSVSGETNEFEGIERIEFADGTLAFDDTAERVYRLYEAAFDREPDLPGLGHWIGRVDQGTDFHEVARAFIDSDEFRDLYGASPSDEEFVDLVYQNVIAREPDASGRSYWLDQIDQGMPRAEVLSRFSDSQENRAAVADQVDDGVFYV